MIYMVIYMLDQYKIVEIFIQYVSLGFVLFRKIFFL